MVKTKKVRSTKYKNKKTQRVYNKKHFLSGDGMLTTVWGPSMRHYLHTVSFNYPVKPTTKDKINYKNLILNMQNTLPCRHCRENLKNNFKAHPLQQCHMKNRNSFSRYVYKLHEIVNKMLGKKSGLSYCDVRERYEHFRSRCTEEKPKIFKFRKTKKKKRVARNHYMEKNQNVLLKLCHKMKNAKRCRLIKNVLKQNLKII